MVCDAYFSHIHSIFKKLTPLLLYLTYYFVQKFTTLNKTDVSLFKQVNQKVWKKNCPDFLYTLYKARRKSESSFSHSFFAIFPFL